MNSHHACRLVVLRPALSLTLLVFGSFITLTAASKTLQVVSTLDLNRYAGRWYEVARLPNRFQESCAGDVTADYMLREDGRVTVTNRCRKADGSTTEAVGIARRVDGQPPSVLQVRFAPAILSFLPQVWGDYQVISLDPDYRHAVVGSPDRKYLWLLSRTPGLESGVYTSLAEAARAQGFDTSALIRTAQKASSGS